MVVGRFTEGKIKHKESLFATAQLEATFQTRKAFVIAFEAGFEECKTLFAQLFPKVDTSLLEIPNVGDTDFECVAIEGASGS